MIIYGNFCGRGQRLKDDGTWPEPIDELDEACMLHDAGYMEAARREGFAKAEKEGEADELFLVRVARLKYGFRRMNAMAWVIWFFFRYMRDKLGWHRPGGILE